MDGDELFGVGVGQWFEDYCVDDVEDCCVGVDVEGECQECYCGEVGLLEQCVEGELKFLKQLFYGLFLRFGLLVE